MNITPAKDCNSIDEVRASIDAIDYEIISLFALRAQYVDEIVKFKSSQEGVVAIDRQKVGLDQISRWASETGLDPALFSSIYQSRINKNDAHELDIFQKR